jgi:hypothetical protein
MYSMLKEACGACCACMLRQVDEAAEAADQQLRQLTAQLSEERLLLAAAASLSVALVALYEHVNTGCSSGWSIPEVAPPPEAPRKPALQAWRVCQEAARQNNGAPTPSTNPDSSSRAADNPMTVAAVGPPQPTPAQPAAAAGVSVGVCVASSCTIDIRGMFPFWLPRCGDIGGRMTVLNDVFLDSSMLLTGPNMAGEGHNQGTWTCRLA